MKDNEKILAVIVGAGILCLVAFFGFRWYSSAISTRRAAIADLETKVERQRRLVKDTLFAKKKLDEYEARSLPPQPAIARSLYQHWLLTKVQEAGLRDQVVSPTGQRPLADVYVQQTFTINGKGRFEQIVQLLHEIYRVDLLHRVSRISLKPIKDTKDLDLSLTVDAVSVSTAPEAKELHKNVSSRLKLASKEKYQESIVGRNIFAPPNQPPKLASLGRQRGTTNRSLEIAAKATDPNPLDLVKYELTKSASKDARLDSAGKFTWTPKKAGEYEFEIAARDDAFPPRVSREKLIVTVTDPPPPTPREDPPPPKLGFDNAKHTVLTGVIEVGGAGEVWLLIRPTAQMLKLHEGDTFEIGSIKGTVREIGFNEFVYESSAKENRGKRLKVARGEILEQATQLPVETSTSAEPDREPKEEPKSELPKKPSTDTTAPAKPAKEVPASDDSEEPKAEKPAAAADDKTQPG